MEANYLLNLIPLSVKDGKYAVTNKKSILIGIISYFEGEYLFKVSADTQIQFTSDVLFTIVGFINNLKEEKLRAEYDNKKNVAVG